MKSTLKLEEIGTLFFSTYLFNELSFSWWVFLALILIPDIGMLGYIINNKAGAFCYNLTHHKGIAFIITMLGWYFQLETATLIGVILLGHSSMDRILGYGLKYQDSFKNTHLGKLN